MATIEISFMTPVNGAGFRSGDTPNSNYAMISASSRSSSKCPAILSKALYSS